MYIKGDSALVGRPNALLSVCSALTMARLDIETSGIAVVEAGPSRVLALYHNNKEGQEIYVVPIAYLANLEMTEEESAVIEMIMDDIRASTLVEEMLRGNAE